jgi:hypothetical protein
MLRNLNVMPQDECAFFAWDVNPQYYSSLHYSLQVARGANSSLKFLVVRIYCSQLEMPATMADQRSLLTPSVLMRELGKPADATDLTDLESARLEVSLRIAVLTHYLFPIKSGNLKGCGVFLVCVWWVHRR